MLLHKMAVPKLPGIVLKYDGHLDKTRDVFKQLATDDIFADVTLASEDKKTLPAHRAVLAYSSPYLFSLFKQNLSERSINLPVKYSHLLSMVEYMYLGMTRVELVEVKEFLAVATRFQIRGLWTGEKEEDSETINRVFTKKKSIVENKSKKENVENKAVEQIKFEIVKSEDSFSYKQGKQIYAEKRIMKYSCDQCEFKATLKRNLRIHKNKNHEKVEKDAQCEECGYIGNQNALKTHKLTHGEKLKCDRCDYTTPMNFRLKEHVINMHEPVYLFCDQCSFRAKRKRYLEGHIAREHEGRIFMCEKCDFSAKFSARFKDHTRGVHEGLKYECDQCDYTAVFKGPMLQHKQVIHNKVRHACKMCDYKATRSSNLRAHERMVHMGEKRKLKE